MVAREPTPEKNVGTPRLRRYNGSHTAQAKYGRGEAMRSLAVFLAVLLTVSVAVAQDQADVSAVALKVGREIPEDKEGKLSFHQEGTTLTLVVRRADKCFVGMDDRKTKLAALTDDKGTSLLRPSKWVSGISSFPRFSEDGHVCVVDVIGTALPAKGAKTIRVKASLAMKCAEGEKTAVQKGLVLKKGSKLTGGPVPWTIEEVGKSDWGDAKLAVTVTGGVSHEMIKEFAFLDADGKKVKHSIGMRSSSGARNHMTYKVTYNLERKVDVVDVKVTYYEKLETIAIPVDLEVGVGL